MKGLFSTALSLTLAFVVAFLGVAQVFGESQKTYVSEIKVAMGGSAESDLTEEGFAILCDENGDPIDLNQGAGGGKYSQGDKKVLMGYKTTTNIKDAITDLAVMNMEGGYDVQEYDLLMKRYMGAQISPFIDKFIVAINEYRENIESEDDVNRQRAEYIRAALNKFTDDDCGGAGLGDLLLNQTVYEMAKPQFDGLSEKEQEDKGIAAVNAEVRDAIPAAEKNQHCDILTLFAQADGQIMLVIYDLITRAADTSDDSWIDRFAAMSYDDLLDSYDMAPTDAKKKAARDFDDDAQIILKSWEDFRTLLLGADDDAQAFVDADLPDYDALQNDFSELENNSTIEDHVVTLAESIIAQAVQSEAIDLAAGFTVADYLESVEYGEGTLYDFFTRTTSEAKADVTALYPLVAALSEGQRAGVEFISLRELVMIGNRDVEYQDSDLEAILETSVYVGVDRGIYQQGGVALTSDALRTKALEKQRNRAELSWLSTKTIVLYAVTGACLLGFIGSVIGWGIRAKQHAAAAQTLNTITQDGAKLIDDIQWDLDNLYEIDHNLEAEADVIANEVEQGTTELLNDISGFKDSGTAIYQQEKVVEGFAAATATARWMSVGFAAATFIMAGISAYMTWQDLKDFYKVDFSPIPRYMVDETSITYTNERGEKLVKENHAAYYEAVTCNRKESDKNFEALGNCADLNGDVGQQWLALYACWDYQERQPILADSFKVVVGSGEIPAGYDNRGIHMFGSDSAFNLNSKLYDWNQRAKSVYVYFKVDETAPVGEASTSGSAFSAGRVAVVAICGVGLGALVTAVCMTAVNKRKTKKATAEA